MTNTSNGSRKTESTQAIDAHIGQKVRWFRLQNGLSQQQLADKLGISYQQLHKYENGSNSASASRLADIAQVLHVNVNDLFDGFDSNDGEWLSPESNREQMLLARYYHQLANDRQREAVLRLIISMADE